MLYVILRFGEAKIMAKRNRMDRRKGLLVGLIGGAVGVVALKVYWEYEAQILPPDFDPPLPDEVKLLPDLKPAFGKLYRRGESPTAAAGRVIYEQVTHEEPDAATRRQLDDAALLAWGMTAGALYGATRTTTRWRDIAGGFFYGLRLFAGDTIGMALLGLRPDPKQVSAREHVSWLLGHWVFSFAATSVTRVLYRLL